MSKNLPLYMLKTIRNPDSPNEFINCYENDHEKNVVLVEDLEVAIVSGFSFLDNLSGGA